MAPLRPRAPPAVHCLSRRRRRPRRRAPALPLAPPSAPRSALPRPRPGRRARAGLPRRSTGRPSRRRSQRLLDEAGARPSSPRTFRARRAGARCSGARVVETEPSPAARARGDELGCAARVLEPEPSLPGPVARTAPARRASRRRSALATIPERFEADSTGCSRCTGSRWPQGSGFSSTRGIPPRLRSARLRARLGTPLAARDRRRSARGLVRLPLRERRVLLPGRPRLPAGIATRWASCSSPTRFARRSRTALASTASSAVTRTSSTASRATTTASRRSSEPAALSEHEPCGPPRGCPDLSCDGSAEA